MTKLKKNKQAPDFTIEDVNGEEFKLSDFKGEKNLYIVLNRGFV